MIKKLTRILTYGFPFFLLAFEYLMRNALKLESQAFMGPTLSAVGVGFLLPILAPKNRTFPISDKLRNDLKESKVLLITELEFALMFITLIAIFILSVSL